MRRQELGRFCIYRHSVDDAGIASAAIFGFVNAWGNFLIPLVLISKAAQQPGPVRMFGFMNSVAINYGAIAAFSISTPCLSWSSIF